MVTFGNTISLECTFNILALLYAGNIRNINIKLISILSTIWIHDHWIPFRDSNQLSYQAMCSIHSHVCVCLCLFVSVWDCRRVCSCICVCVGINKQPDCNWPSKKWLLNKQPNSMKGYCLPKSISITCNILINCCFLYIRKFLTQHYKRQV